MALVFPAAVAAQTPAPAPSPAPAPATPLTPGAPGRPDAVLAPGGRRFIVPSDYLLGPGDLVEIQITGRIDIQRQQLVIDITGGFSLRAKPEDAFVTFRTGRTHRLTDAPALEPGATIVVPEVSVKWYQDYIAISNTIIGLITAYVGLYVLFGGTTANVSLLGNTTTPTGATGR